MEYDRGVLAREAKKPNDFCDDKAGEGVGGLIKKGTFLGDAGKEGVISIAWENNAEFFNSR